MLRKNNLFLKVGGRQGISKSTPGPNNFRNHLNDKRVASDRGSLGSGDIGNQFTERDHYHSRGGDEFDQGMISRQLSADRTIRGMRRQDYEQRVLKEDVRNDQRQEEEGGGSRTGGGGGGGPSRFRGHLRDPIETNKLPSTTNERRRSNYYNERDLGLRSMGVQGAEELSMDPNDIDVTHKMLLASKANKDVYRAMENNMVLSPRDEGEEAKLKKNLRSYNSADDRVLGFQNRLAEEEGIFSPQRMQAYMLSDDSIFPQWVDAEVPQSYRNAVRYGNLGLSDYDSVTRLRLAKLPADERKVEWERLRKAREYRDGKERPLTESEKEQLKRSMRQNYWLVQKRQERANTIKRLALAKPDEYSAFPSNAIDYSSRLALVAKHIEAGVETKGKWPLSPSDLALALKRKRREEASITFSRDGARREQNLSKMDPQIAEAFDSLHRDKQPKEIKRVSITKYHRRWKEVMNGKSDEHGRNYDAFRTDRKLVKHSPLTAPKSADELRMQRQLGMAPGMNSSNEIGGRHSAAPRMNHGWSRAHDRMSFGGNAGGTSGGGMTQKVMHNPFFEE